MRSDRKQRETMSTREPIRRVQPDSEFINEEMQHDIEIEKCSTDRSGQTNQPKQATTSHNPPLSLKKRIQGTRTSLYAVDNETVIRLCAERIRTPVPQGDTNSDGDQYPKDHPSRHRSQTPKTP